MEVLVKLVSVVSNPKFDLFGVACNGLNRSVVGFDPNLSAPRDGVGLVPLLGARGWCDKSNRSSECSNRNCHANSSSGKGSIHGSGASVGLFGALNCAVRYA